MGVLRCNRRGCENIMCDRYSHEHGYICNECFSEFVRATGTDSYDFMKSEKGHEVIEQDREEYCNNIFPLT